MSKKKYYLFSLVLLFGMLFVTFSTCYAKTTLTDDEAEYIYNYIFKQDYNTNSAYNFYYDPDSNYGKSSVYSSGLTAFKNIFNSTNDYDIDRNKTIFYTFIRRFNASSYSLYLYYGNFNNGKNDNLPHFYFYYDNSNSIVKILALDDDKSFVHYPIKCMRFNISSDAISFNSYYDTYVAENDNSTSVLKWFKIANWNLNNLNQGNSLLEQIGGIINLSSTNAIYTNYDGSFFYNTPITKLLQSSYVNSDSPVNPDIPEDTGNTGEITDTNGDVTGQIDLSGIQNGIGNINQSINNQAQAIIDNQNTNTQATISAINNANENYWGSNDDLDGEEQEDFISDSVNSLVDNVSGELNSNAVFQHLDTAENTFLNFFRNKQDESYYDLIISWDAISPVITMFGGSVTVSNGQSIISGDSINFSQLCRENVQLGKIQQYIRIIFNFSCLIALLWQIYNLVLSTLGIDNPYLYEDADVTDVVNGDTGEVKTFYRTHKRYYKKR